MKKDNVAGLIMLMNREGLEEFEKMTSLQKSKTLFNDFSDFHKFQELFARSKGEKEKERSLFEQERAFSKINKEVAMMEDRDWMSFVGLIDTKITQIEKDTNDKTRLKKLMVLGSILRVLPNDLGDDISDSFEALKDRYLEICNQFVM